MQRTWKEELASMQSQAHVAAPREDDAPAPVTVVEASASLHDRSQKSTIDVAVRAPFFTLDTVAIYVAFADKGGSAMCALRGVRHGTVHTDVIRPLDPPSTMHKMGRWWWSDDARRYAAMLQDVTLLSRVEEGTSLLRDLLLEAEVALHRDLDSRAQAEAAAAAEEHRLSAMFANWRVKKYDSTWKQFGVGKWVASYSPANGAQADDLGPALLTRLGLGARVVTIVGVAELDDGTREATALRFR